MPFLRALAIVLFMTPFYALACGLAWTGPKRRAERADRLAVMFCRVLLFLLGVRVQISGHVVATPALIVANHVSWIDILAFGCLPQVCFLAKSEVGRWPIVARLARLKGTVFVDRQRHRSILPANAAIAARLAEGRSVVVFPEGTTSDGRIVGRFGSSHVEAAFTAAHTRADIMVQPVALAYDHHGAAWIGDASLLPHLWSLLRQGRIECTLIFAKPMALRPDRKPLTQAAHIVVASELARLQKTPLTPGRRSRTRNRDAPDADRYPEPYPTSLMRSGSGSASGVPE